MSCCLFLTNRGHGSAFQMGSSLLHGKLKCETVEQRTHRVFLRLSETTVQLMHVV